jgi:hypothetical protein
MSERKDDLIKQGSGRDEDVTGGSRGMRSVTAGALLSASSYPYFWN